LAFSSITQLRCVHRDPLLKLGKLGIELLALGVHRREVDLFLFLEGVDVERDVEVVVVLGDLRECCKVLGMITNHHP
jgi:hypothetical protein